MKNFTFVYLLLHFFSINAFAQQEVSPHFEMTPAPLSVFTSTQLPLTARLQSMGDVDRLISVNYFFYYNDVLIDNLLDYADISYSVRSQGTNVYESRLDHGAGVVSFSIGNNVNVNAISMGIIDNFCVNRNRPIELDMNFFVAGSYRLVLEIVGCSNDGTVLPIGGFTSNNNEGCTQGAHSDRFATSCDNPVVLSTRAVQLEVVQNPELPIVNYTNLHTTYQTDLPIEIIGNVRSNGFVDPLCGIYYEFTRNDQLITDATEFMDLRLQVRLEDEAMFEMDIVNGSGFLTASVLDYTIGAFSLGIFDNHCVQRNRPIAILGSFYEDGLYTLKTQIIGCSETPIALGTDFLSSCDNLVHADYYAGTCTQTQVLYTDLRTFQINELDVSIEKVTSTSNKIYPTVVSNILNIESTAAGAIKIINALGQVILVKQIKMGLQQIEVSQLNEGVYFVEVNNSVQRIVKR